MIGITKTSYQIKIKKKERVCLCYSNNIGNESKFLLNNIFLDK